MLGENKKYSCFEHKEPRCRTETCANSEFDPRSFCHSICAKPKHVCGETACEKFISVEAHGAKRIVCVPRPKCEIKRRFGPIVEDVTVKQEAESIKTRPSKVSNNHNKQGHDANANVKKDEKAKGGDAEEVKELMENLTEKIDSEGIAAIYALAGSDLCSCCECKICQCKLRNVDSQTLQDIRKRALITKRINEEELIKLKEELDDREDLTEDEKRSFIEEILEEQDEFDYFYEPKLEVFEQERQRKQEKKRQIETEKKKRDEQKAEEERKRIKEGALVKMEVLEEEVQAEPETAEHGSQHSAMEPGKDVDYEVEEQSDEAIKLNDEHSKLDDAAIRKDENFPKYSSEASKLSDNVSEPSGDVSKFSGDVSKVSGDVSKLSGNVSNLSGAVSEFSGDSSKFSPDTAKFSGGVSKFRDEFTKYSEEVTKHDDEVTKFGDDVSKSPDEFAKLHDEVNKSTDEVPKMPDQVGEDKSKATTEWTDYKTTEWAGVRHQDQPTVIDRAKADAKEKVSLASLGPSLDAATERVSEVSEYSTKFRPTPTPPPSISHQPSAGQQQLDLQQLHSFDQAWLDDNEKSSIPKTTVPDIESVEPSDSLPSKQVNDVKPTKAKKKKKVPSTKELMGSFISADSKASEVSEATTVSALSTARQEEEAVAIPKNLHSYSFEKVTSSTDMCKCLPGYCTCAEQHYTFKKDKDTEDFGMAFKQLLVDKMVSAKEEENGSEFSGDSSCSCVHTEEEMKVTPITSRIEVVRPSTPYIEPEVKKSLIKRFVKCVRPKYQKTVVIIKPEAVRFKDVILRAIKKEGLEIVEERCIQLTPEQVAEIYAENFGSAYFPMFVQQMSSAPIMVLAIAGQNAVERWKGVVGPDRKIPMSWFYPASMRRRFSIHKDIFHVMKISEDFQNAKTEIRYFFPLNIIDPIMISSTMIQDYCDKFIHPTLLKGLHQVVLRKPSDPISFLAEWLLINNPFQPFYRQIQVSLSPT